MANKKYSLSGKEYTAKEKYSLTDWGKIIKLLQNVEEKDPIVGAMVVLLGNQLVDLLNLILSKNIEGELFEDDIQEVGVIISDFFTRKKSLISTGKNSLQN